MPSVRKVVEYALTRVSASKIFFGIPTYGYDWTLPYVKGSGVGAPSISPVEAIDIKHRGLYIRMSMADCTRCGLRMSGV